MVVENLSGRKFKESGGGNGGSNTHKKQHRNINMNDLQRILDENAAVLDNVKKEMSSVEKNEMEKGFCLFCI